MCVHDRDTLEILAVNRAMVRDYGYSREELLSMNLRDIRLPAQTPPTAHAPLQRAANSDWGEWRHRMKDGSVIIAAVHGVDAELDGRAVRLCLAEDITERKRTEQVLHEYAQRLQELSRRLLHVQEAERRVLAKELHDEVGQSLTAVKLNLHAMKKLVADKAATERLGDSLEIVELTISQIRDRALDLRPSVLDDLGLVPALDWYVKRQAKRGECAICLDAQSLTERAPAQVEIACFRVVQEAVNNALRHGHPKRIDVALSRKHDRLRLTVRDDGRGFAVILAIERSRGGGGLGLLGMRERAELIGGEFSLRSAPGEGAEICVEFPWSGAGSGTDARIAG
jgi:PAS domain S-box-containing protein